MRTIYICGVMRGPDLNFPAFHAAEALWRAAGWNVINPASLDADLDVNAPRKPRGYYMKRDLPLVAACDAVALLPRWYTGPGCRAEVYVAMACELEIFDGETMEAMHDVWIP